MGMKSVNHMQWDELVKYLKDREGSDFPAHHMPTDTAKKFAVLTLSRTEALIEALRAKPYESELYLWVWKNHYDLYKDWVGPDTIPPELPFAGD